MSTSTLNEDLVRLTRIEEESCRLALEAQAIPSGAPPLELARLSAIEDAMEMLLAEARVLHARVGPEISRMTAEMRKPRKRASVVGSLKALFHVGQTIFSFATNPIVVLIVILTLFYNATAMAL